MKSAKTTHNISVWIAQDTTESRVRGLTKHANYFVDNHDSSYLGMVVQLYVQAHLGHYHVLTRKEYSQKLMAQLKSTPLLPIISTGVLIVGLSRKMRKQGVRISPPVRDGQELSLYVCLYDHC